MNTEVPRPVLTNKKALVVGIANDHSIAYGCAKAFHEVGAELAITYLNEKAKPYVEPLDSELEAPIIMPMNVANPGELESVFDRISSHLGQLDILVHSIAFAPKEDLQGGLLNCSSKGYSTAMDISCHSFIRMDEKRAIALIPKLLKGHEHAWPELIEDIRKIVTAAGPLGEEDQRRLTRLEQLTASDPSDKKRRRKSSKAGEKVAVTK